MILNEFWVLVHRHLDPEAWGLHHFLMVESPVKDGYQGMYAKPFGWKPGLGLRGPGPVYRKTTVGLYDPPHMRSLLSGLHQQVPGLANVPVPAEIADYVYYQVAPTEWHSELARGVQEVCDRLTVLARREHPAPVPAFIGQAS